MVSMLVLVIALTVGVAFCLGSEEAAASTVPEDKLMDAVVLYPGSMYALIDNNMTEIDPSNDLITPFIQNSRTLIPVRFVAESFGADVSWNQSAQIVSISAAGKVISLKINSTEMNVDGKIVKLDIPATITGNRTFVPVRALAESLGRNVFYDRGLIVISSNASVWDSISDKDLISQTINRVNILPSVESRAKLVSMLNGIETTVSGYGIKSAAAPESTDTQTASGNATETRGDLTPSYSETNIQVKGVDESDIVKTDGTYIYQVTNNNVVIYKAYPVTELSQISKIVFSDAEFSPTELYVKGNHLVVVGSSYTYSSGSGIGISSSASLIYPPYYDQTSVKAEIYDISDKRNPAYVREVYLPGNYLSSRMIGNELYLISSQYIYNWADSSADLNPQYSDTAVGKDAISIPYDQICYMPPVISPSYLVLMGLSLDKPSEPANVRAYLGAGENVYVSTNNLYVALDEGYGGIRPMIVTSSGFWQPPATEATLVFKFALNNAKTTFMAHTQVPGTIINQFSMDENGNTFRIATTLGNSWFNGTDGLSNNIYVLDSNLNQSGKLEGLAIGEKIYSVRFIGNKAYVVTFRTVDPLFVIDMTNPTAPQVLGSLKIPGYSNYLQPYDENHIIGFGKDAITVPYKNGDGVVSSTATYYLGMKVALFDVSDVTNPIQESSVNIGDRGTDSELLYDHRALLFNQANGLLAFPVNEAKINGPIIDPSTGYPQYGTIVFSGAYIYHLDLKTGFTLQGKITYMTDADLLLSGTYSIDNNKQIRRLLYIENVLYGISNGELSAYDLTTLKELGSVLIK